MAHKKDKAKAPRKAARYQLEFLESALDEWNSLDGAVRQVLKKLLEKRLETPRMPGAQLHGELADCYKIKLRKQGYRLVYQVRDTALVVLVIAVDRRDKDKVYQAALDRIRKMIVDAVPKDVKETKRHWIRLGPPPAIEREAGVSELISSGASASNSKASTRMKSRSSITTRAAARVQERPHPIHPGKFLAEGLAELKLSQAEFARAIGVSTMRISHVVKGSRPVTAELALLFGRAFEQSPQYWLNLQRQYDLEIAEKALGVRLHGIQPFPRGGSVAD